MKSLLNVSFLLTIIISCNSRQSDKLQREGEPEVYYMEETDAEMNEAIKKANESIDQFKNALLNMDPKYNYFALKARFNTEEGGEHIWLGNVWLKNDMFYGVVDNLPVATSDVQLGDTVQVLSERISDWMMIENQRLIGGYTIRLLRKRMTEDERKQFDSENGLIIED